MAGQIPQRFIDDLLARADIAELIGERVTLKKAGRNFQGLCPFHDEKSPSFTVSPDKQFYHCFGCGANGNALRFLMEYDGLRFPEAVEQLASRYAMEVPRDTDDDPKAQARARERKRQQEASEHVLETAARFYRHQLGQHDAEQARQYLRSRGVSSELAKRFSIGFAPDSWDSLKHALNQRQVSEQEQVEFGLLIEKEGSNRTYDRFRNRVMFPIRDWKGRVLGFGGRVLDDSKPKYLNSPETPVFHKGRELYGLYESRQAAPRAERLLIVEGYMDVVALAQFGIDTAVATLGTATTETHLTRLFRLVSEVVFCFDGDSAGRQAAVKALSTVLPQMIDGRQARFLFLPEGDDPDSLVRREGADAFNERVLCASSLSEFLFEQSSNDVDLKQVEGRERFVSRALGFIRLLPEGVLKTVMIDALSERSGVERGRINTLLGEKADSAPADSHFERSYDAEPSSRAQPARTRFGDQTLNASERALLLLLHSPESIESVPEGTQWCPDTDSGTLLAKVVELIRAGQYRSAQVILMHFHGTEQGAHLQRLVKRQDLLLPAQYRAQELKNLVEHFKRQQTQLSPQQEYDALREKEQRGERLNRDDAVRMWQLAQELSSGQG
ncbi:DNA primase [Larsenimonas suaedae]|uniref:DNA primase n=1 Tax=Larsenimonas suaedae TaxID=1851019 RepID=A0ABU1GTL5_9GAMM|nr:DNA primase [Larsenimonas suaedae]MCM2971820.1 DNA primase [Larsenimonas suaedae]MDR5895372.1 DNA primase [Larsenimonas suaedae]